jgi:hypothetical protein
VSKPQQTIRASTALGLETKVSHTVHLVHSLKNHKLLYPNFARYALILIVTPALSAECERTFGKAGNTPSPRHFRLEFDKLEAGECFGFCNAKELVILDAAKLAMTGKSFHVRKLIDLIELNCQ